MGKFKTASVIFLCLFSFLLTPAFSEEIYRTWTLITGVQYEASFIELDKNNVLWTKTRSGTILRQPLEVMSAQDRDYIQSLKPSKKAKRTVKGEVERMVKIEAERKAKAARETKEEAGRTIRVTHWPSGQKRSEKHFKDGEEDGLQTSWYENGNKKSESHVKDGEEDGLQAIWYENGNKKSESHVKDGKKDGIWTRWYENGNKKSEVHYKNGELDGLTTRWRKNGTKISEIQYEDGKSVSRKEF